MYLQNLTQNNIIIIISNISNIYTIINTAVAFIDLNFHVVFKRGNTTSLQQKQKKEQEFFNISESDSNCSRIFYVQIEEDYDSDKI